jgi:hypothetical protein
MFQHRQCLYPLQNHHQNHQKHLFENQVYRHLDRHQLKLRLKKQN